MNLNNTDSVDSLIQGLPSIYNDYFYNDDFFPFLFDKYVDIINFLTSYTTSIYNNNFMNSTEMYRNLNMAVIPLQKSLYSVMTIAPQFKLVSGFNWFDSTTPMAAKVNYLDSLGLYETLDFSRSWDTVPPQVICLSLAKDFSGLEGNYIELIDYVVYNNKLYVFNDLAKFPIRTGGTRNVLAQNIMLDYSKLENEWGVFFPAFNTNYMAKYEYKNILATLVAANTTISSIRQVSSLLFSSGNVSLKDAYSRKNLPVSYLTDPTQQQFNPFEFKFHVPSNYLQLMTYVPSEFVEGKVPEYPGPFNSSLVSESDYTNLVTDFVYILASIQNIDLFLNMIKPSYTSYTLECAFDCTENQGAYFTDTCTAAGTTHASLMEPWPYNASSTTYNTGVFDTSIYDEQGSDSVNVVLIYG